MTNVKPRPDQQKRTPPATSSPSMHFTQPPASRLTLWLSIPTIQTSLSPSHFTHPPAITLTWVAPLTIILHHLAILTHGHQPPPSRGLSPLTHPATTSHHPRLGCPRLTLHPASNPLIIQPSHSPTSHHPHLCCPHSRSIQLLHHPAIPLSSHHHLGCSHSPYIQPLSSSSHPLIHHQPSLAFALSRLTLHPTFHHPSPAPILLTLQRSPTSHSNHSINANKPMGINQSHFMIFLTFKRNRQKRLLDMS